jgi:hypothetical protein
MPQRVPIMSSNADTDCGRDSDTDIEEIIVLSGGNYPFRLPRAGVGLDPQPLTSFS